VAFDRVVDAVVGDKACEIRLETVESIEVFLKPASKV
jgi:hypothetical protein